MVGYATTVGAVSANVVESETIPDGSGITADIVLQGRETTTGEVVGWRGQVEVARVSGVTTIVGATLEIVAMRGDAGLVAATISVTISNHKIRITPTGVLLKTIEWMGSVRYFVN